MLKAPFPYYGGKSRVAQMVWERFGKVDRYLEPFAGSLAVLLYKDVSDCFEVVCDTNGYICNFWNAIKFAPDEVAEHACNPTIHQQLTARQKFIYKWLETHEEQLAEDPDFYDAKIAGWWCWGMSSWIGCNYGIPSHKKFSEIIPNIHASPGGKGVSAQKASTFDGQSERFSDIRPFCSHDGSGISPRRAEFAEKIPAVNAKNKGAGAGVSAQKDNTFSDIRPMCTYDRGTGVRVQGKSLTKKPPDQQAFSDKRPFVTSEGSGMRPTKELTETMSEKRPSITPSDAGRSIPAQSQFASMNNTDTPTLEAYQANIRAWFRQLQDRLLRVTVLNRDWTSLTSPSVLGNTKTQTSETALFLDPPYITSDRSQDLYVSDKRGISDKVARECFEWAVKHGEAFRIAYCCTQGDFDLPDGWTEYLQSYGGIKREDKREKMDCIMFSPRCVGEADLWS